MAAYLDTPTLKLLSIIPPDYLDFIESSQAGWTAKVLERWSAWIDARLAKRYATPFGSPAPIAVQGWLSDIVTHEAYLKRGIDPTDQQVQDVAGARKRAEEEIKEAADAKDGMFELPLRADTTAQGISKGAPLFYSETSPYHTWSEQAADGKAEDDGDF